MALSILKIHNVMRTYDHLIQGMSIRKTREGGSKKPASSQKAPQDKVSLSHRIQEDLKTEGTKKQDKAAPPTNEE